MQTKSNINWKKLLQGVSLAAFAAAPVFGTTGISQAAPPDHAPAYGYRNRNDNNYDRHRDDDDDDDDRDNRDRDNFTYDNYDNSTRSLEGVVVNDLRGRDFVLRLDNGRNVRVQLDEREPQRLSQGDRVRVQGSFDQTNRDNRSNTRYNDNLVFRADDVRIIRDRNNGNNNNYNGRRTLTGVVTRVRSDQRFTLSALNRTFEVASSSRLPRTFKSGNLVRITGDMRDNNITNASVTIVSRGSGNNGNYGYNGNYNNGGNYNGNYNSSANTSVNFPAVVLNSSDRDNTLRVRGENGREYTVRTNDADNWDRGDRVRIKGRTQNGVIVADDIDKL